MELEKLTDEEIIYKLQEIKKSNFQFFEVYFEEIFNRYRNQVFNICRYYGLQTNDALDVIQDAFVKLINFTSSFKKDSLFKPWFFKIVLNIVRNKYNELKKYSFVPIEEVDSSKTFFEEKVFEKIQNKEYIVGILNRIPRKLREVVLLNIYGELEPPDIARVLGISLRQVYNRLKRSNELLKEVFGEERDLYD